MKKKKYNCEICEDTGTFTNPFDQTFICKCQDKKRKKADYRGFVLYIYEMSSKYPQATFSMSDLRRLAERYNCPIPKEYR